MRCPLISTPGWPARVPSSTRSSAPASRGRRGSRRAAAIDAINRCGAPVVACDIASGVDASSGEIAGAAVEADLTVTFHAAKLGQRVAPGKWHTGELRVVPIGIPDGAPGRAGWRRHRPRRPRPRTRAVAPARPSSAPARWRSPASSRGLTGAVRMSSLAAIRAGAGYATVAVPADLEPVFEAGEPEVMSVGCPGGDGCLVPGLGEGRPACLRARGGRGARAGHGPRSRLGRAGARDRRRDRGAAGDRRRRPQRLCRAPRPGRRPGCADAADAPRRRARAPAGARLRRRSPPTGSPAPARPPGPPARSSC